MKKISFSILAAILLVSCTKFLDKSPLDKLTPEQAFVNENTLQLYVNSFYTQMLPNGPTIYKGDVMSDITVPNAVPQYIGGTFGSQQSSGWSWTTLRNINYFLEHYNNPAITQKARNHYAGIARYFRALFYFNMVKQFGNVPWYSKTLNVEDASMYKTQDSRILVMDSVLADIDFACNNIYVAKDNSASQITKWVALALKSKICLFEGTFRKYHTEISIPVSATQWFQEAADAASKLIVSGTYKLQNTGAPDKDYRSLFISENPVSTEVLLAAVYNNSLKKWHDAAWWYNSATLGSRLGLSKTFMNTYLNSDGSRFTDKAGYDTMQFQYEVKNRDSRLQSTIRAGAYKRTDGSPAPPDFTVSYSGYQIQKFSMDDKYFDTRSESYNSIPIARYAEVLLNYAEAKAEMGTLSLADWNLSIGALRSRAGITNTTMPVSADPYMQQLFPDISNAVLLEIRRERAIELAAEGYRYNDLIRWKAGKLLEKGYDGIYVPAKDKLLDLNEDGKFDVCFVDKTPATRVPGVTYFLLDNVTSKLSKGTGGNLLWLNNTPKKYDDKKYLYPIPANDMLLNPNLVQNKGW
ncbi:MAG: RagB/SusD family nutrient uptake outer membrane protein [Chitinophagaceae bacterium]|nr:RagB/SusD family nutrient uptake outer membrane protein [Chitinophagaceae bacterium]MDP1764645.1 RagB/SusD family nutrient uptake outer membrane protein [Sediminibacterium sp.]MDP1810567.1 RagB/SusD family nutrient uptake outer membrane protein [Sediminibacterium sp.]MDP3128121.1 RagB/SusD family nutrient uptake outer membrane protein [Sediminibacterium sp.]MDP3665517.1 RagB/SusD family nutrient uptake outer membrane protein [Sediminibacterium sp.]